MSNNPEPEAGPLTDHKKRWIETLPGILTGIAAIIGAVASLYVALNDRPQERSNLEPQQVDPARRPPTDSSSERSSQFQPQQPPQFGSTPPINIGSTWRELYPNPGSLSRIIQDGETFTFTVGGTVQGLPFQSSGSGTIRGQTIESRYRSTVPSSGRCAGSVSADGMQTRFTCIDSVNGRYETAWIRE